MQFEQAAHARLVVGEHGTASYVPALHEPVHAAHCLFVELVHATVSNVPGAQMVHGEHILFVMALHAAVSKNPAVHVVQLAHARLLLAVQGTDSYEVDGQACEQLLQMRLLVTVQVAVS